MASELTEELVATIAAQLHETQDEPIEQIRRSVAAIGAERCAALVRCALRLEQLGGLFRNDGQRRTPGGVYFALVRGVVNRRQYRQIWHNLKQTKAAGDESAASIHSQDGAGFVMRRDSIIIGPVSNVVNATVETRPYNESKSPRRA